MNKPMRARSTPFGLAAIGCAGLLALAGCQSDQVMQRASQSVAPELAPEPVGAVAAALTYDVAPTQAERYAPYISGDFTMAADQPYSTFAADVDTAAYVRIRRFLNDGMLPPADLVRIEELVNYFDYDYPVSDDRYHPITISTALAPSPWNDRSQILRIGMQGFEEETVLRPPLNLVFLVDVSGSMGSDDRLPMAQQGLADLVDQLRPVDRVAIVTYAGGVATVLEPTTGDNLAEIRSAVLGLSAGGSTNGAGGLEAAYNLAAENYDDKAVNRVILVTDGDFNVGESRPDQIGDYVASQRSQGIYMTVLGLGAGNLNDAIMQQIAQRGDGIAAYVDGPEELRRVLSDATAHTLFPIADDIKIQVTFNPAQVAEYRLIGYETRAITREEFEDDTADGGDISAGHSVTAIYEVVPALPVAAIVPSELPEVRFAAFTPEPVNWTGDGLAVIQVRYQRPRSDVVEEIVARVDAADAVRDIEAADADTRFAAAVAGFGLLLRDDPSMLRGFDFDAVRDLAAGALGTDALGARAEFVTLVERAAEIAN